MFERFMRKMRVGRSVLLILVSLVFMFLTRCSVDSSTVVSKFPANVSHLSTDGESVFAEFVTMPDKQRFTLRNTTIITNFANKNIRYYHCVKYASGTISCVEPK